MVPTKRSTHGGGKREATRSLKEHMAKVVGELSVKAGMDRGKLVDMVRAAWTRDAVGRPAVPPEKRKTKVIQVRVTEAEHEMLKREAKRAGVTVSVLLRRTVKRVAKGK